MKSIQKARRKMIISDYMLHLARNKLAWPTMGTIPKTADQVLIQSVFSIAVAIVIVI
jgi:hypothetical protein